MKLAEALSTRADLQRRIAQIKNRLFLNAKVQEGEKPAEDPAALLKELDALVDQLTALATRINLTNSNTVTGGESITELLAQRDGKTLKLGILRDFLANASSVVTRGTRSEIKINSTVNVAAQQKEIDRQAKDLRELDMRLQELNWTTELL